MGEHKTPKLTTKLELTLLERLSVHGVIRAHKPADRDDERRWSRAWDAIDLDGALASGRGTDDGRTEFKVADLKKARRFDVTAEILDTLAKLPASQSVEQARVISPVRDKIDKAKESLK